MTIRRRMAMKRGGVASQGGFTPMTRQAGGVQNQWRNPFLLEKGYDGSKSLRDKGSASWGNRGAPRRGKDGASCASAREKGKQWGMTRIMGGEITC